MNEVLKALFNSFIAGFCLAWELSQKLNIYEKERPVPTSDFVEQGALAMSEKTEKCHWRSLRLKNSIEGINTISWCV